MDVRDEHHIISERGFRQLRAVRTRLLIPLPIVFEVYKHVAYLVNVQTAYRAFEYMPTSFEILYLDSGDVVTVQEMIVRMPWWGGSLEDATLAMVALQRDVPLWTFNYRDLTAFPNLEFWSPG